MLFCNMTTNCKIPTRLHQHTVHYLRNCCRLFRLLCVLVLTVLDAAFLAYQQWQKLSTADLVIFGYTYHSTQRNFMTVRVLLSSVTNNRPRTPCSVIPDTAAKASTELNI